MESVWSYPRPPALQPCERRVRVVLGGVTIVDSTAALRVLETSHPPTIYVPPADIVPGCLTEEPRAATVCEFKGEATYLAASAGDRTEHLAAWTYRAPWPPYAALRDHVAFYPSRMDACYLDDELVQSQPSDFYGGWITADLMGPFKGPPGTLGW